MNNLRKILNQSTYGLTDFEYSPTIRMGECPNSIFLIFDDGVTLIKESTHVDNQDNKQLKIIECYNNMILNIASSINKFRGELTGE